MPQYLQFSVYFSNKALVNSSSRIYSCFRTVRSSGFPCGTLQYVSCLKHQQAWPASISMWCQCSLNWDQQSKTPGLIHTESICVLNVHIMCMSIYECVFDRMDVGRVSVNLLPEWTVDQREPQRLHGSFIDHTQTYMLPEQDGLGTED